MSGISQERVVASIQVGNRHRTDLGDIDALAESIRQHGLLQPITITPEGVLVCGARRLAALKLLGIRTAQFWVRAGISDRLDHLLSEQDDNVLHKPLTQIEAAALYRELKQLMTEDAKRRQQATHFTAERQPGVDGAANFAAPSVGQLGRAREQAAAMIPGGASHTTLDKIGHLEEIANDPTQPEPIRRAAASDLAAIENGAPVDPAYKRIREAVADARRQRETEMHQRADEAVKRAEASTKEKTAAKRSTGPTAGQSVVLWPSRGFINTWTELDGWWHHYDPEALAAELTEDQAARFLSAVDGTVAFAQKFRDALARENGAEDVDDVAPVRRLHAL